MSDLTSNTPTAASEVTQLRNECADLQSQTHTLRIVLLFVIGALCLFFWREASFNGGITVQLQPQILQAAQMAEALNKQGTSMEKQVQAIQAAVQRLVEYGRSHPDYVPILNKYGIPIGPAAPAGTAPAPAAPQK